MKKLTASFLLFVLILSLMACSSPADSSKEPLIFYYPWADLEAAMKQNPDCTAIGSEERDISGNRDNLRYLLTLYFRGPLDSSLESPFPSGTAVSDAAAENDTLILTLSAAFAQLEDMELTLACTCLARTCFELTEAQTVMIKTLPAEDEAEISITITRDNYLLEDDIPEATTTE